LEYRGCQWKWKTLWRDHGTLKEWRILMEAERLVEVLGKKKKRISGEDRVWRTCSLRME
jgi:hypothetical protein